jgi:glycosyltransferase involved in cell wall biosynthesis
MRVMYLCISAEMGGAERSLFDIMSSIRRAQPSWALHLVTAADGPLVGLAQEIGVTTAVLPMPASVARIGEAGSGGRLRLAARLLTVLWTAERYARRIRREIGKFRPDVLHTNSLKMHLLGGWAAGDTADTAGSRAEGPPVVWHMHDYIGSRPMTARLLRHYVRKCKVIVANSMSVAEDVRASIARGVPVVPVLNAVDLERFSPSGPRADLDALSGLPPAAPGVVRVGLVAMLGRWKGHATFLEAIARLPPDVAVRAYVVGGALYHTAGSQHSVEDLRRRAAELGISDRVGFTGFVAKSGEALRALDVVVHASTAPEPFGLVIVEAMACGRAVIASDAGGAREIFTPGVDALSHDPGNADDLAARIAQLARDAGLRERLGRAGRETAERRFDRARLAADMLPVYELAIAVP